MEVLSEHAVLTIPNKEPGLEEDFGRLSVQKVAELAVAAHAGEEACDEDDPDTHTDLLAFPPIRRKSGINMPIKRAQSMRISRPLMAGGPVQNSDAPRAPLRRTYSNQRSDRPPLLGVARNSSALGLSRNTSIRRMAPHRSMSTDSHGSLRGGRRDQLVNVSIRSKDRPFDQKSIMRTRSGDDLSIASAGLDSCFTTDSINLRKCQLIADPLDGYYDDLDSFADHDTLCDAMSQYNSDFDGYTEHEPGPRVGFGDHSSFSTLDSFQIRQANDADSCDVSLFSQSNSYSDDLEDTITESFDENPTEAGLVDTVE